MSRIHANADDERNSLVLPHERTFSASSQVNANNAKSYTDLDQFSFSTDQTNTQQTAVDFTPADDSKILQRLDVFGMYHARPLECEKKLQDLDRGVKNQQALVDFTPAGDSDKPERLSELSRALMRRHSYLEAVSSFFARPFEHGRLDDLDQAIKYLRAAVDLTPAGDSDKPERLSELAKLLMRRHSDPWTFKGSFFGPDDLDDLDEAIKYQRAAVDLTPAGGSDKPGRLSELARLLMRRYSDPGIFEGVYLPYFERAQLDQAIKYQRAAVDLTPAGDSDKPERLSELVRLLMRRHSYAGIFKWGLTSPFKDKTFNDLCQAIKYHRAAVDLTPADDERMLEDRSELVRLLMLRQSELGTFKGSCKRDQLDQAIKNQEALVDLTPAGDSDKPERLSELARLLMCRHSVPWTLKLCFIFGDGSPDDLDQAIKYQRAAVDLTPAGDPDKPERLSELARLFMHRHSDPKTWGFGRPVKDTEGFCLRSFERDQLDQAIKYQGAAVDLTPAEDECMPGRRMYLEALLERRLQMVDDGETWPSLRASVTTPTMLGGGKCVYETVKDKLVKDLQQLSICIKKSKHRELATTLGRMERAIFCLKFQDGDKLCQDIFKASTRLGVYCQALRNLAGDKTNQKELEDLYEEFVRIEREFSAAHDRINSKYEQLYKQWKAERQSISKFLSKAGSAKSQSDNLEVRALVEQVDAGFERMGNVLKNEANDLKNLSETLNGLSKLVHLPPDPPIASNDPAQIPPQPPDPPSTPSKVSTQVDDVIETISQVDALVKKSRYTKARQVVSETSSKTTQKLKKLRTSSEGYEEESQTLSCLRTHHHNDDSRDIRNRQRELCNQLLNFVGGMGKMLKGIEKGFSGCKAFIQGLVFRPLGDLLCDLEPYLPQAGLEVSSKGLHPDLILYEAAFQAIADSIPAQSKLLERIKGFLSVLDELRGV